MPRRSSRPFKNTRKLRYKRRQRREERGRDPLMTVFPFSKKLSPKNSHTQSRFERVHLRALRNSALILYDKLNCQIHQPGQPSLPLLRPFYAGAVPKNECRTPNPRPLPIPYTEAQPDTHSSALFFQTCFPHQRAISPWFKYRE